MKPMAEDRPRKTHRPGTVQENQEPAPMGLALTPRERFEWLCRTVEELSPLLGKARTGTLL